MAAHLRQKDLLVVGFWSDWEHLNAVIGSALADVDPLSVTVIDPSPIDALEDKPPDLWAIAHADNVTFTHVRASGADELDEFRQAFSQSYARQVLGAGRAIFEEKTGAACDPTWLDAAAFDSETLCDWGRDAEGVPRTQPASTYELSGARILSPDTSPRGSRAAARRL
jgi:hypothetical protein